MTRAEPRLFAAALGLGVLFGGPVEAQPFVYPPEPVAWRVGPGYFGFSGYPWPGPPFASPVLGPTAGCYDARARLKNAWRRVEVCY